MKAFSRTKIFTLVFLAVLFLSSCKNYYNEMIRWSSNIPIGTSIDSVKAVQPKFLEIDWNHPRVFGNETQFIITRIKNNNDLLKMENYLSFVNNKYQGRFAHK